MKILLPEAICVDDLTNLAETIIVLMGSKIHVVVGSTSMYYDSQKVPHAEALIEPEDLDIDLKADRNTITKAIQSAVNSVFPDAHVVEKSYSRDSKRLKYEIVSKKEEFLTSIDVHVKNSKQFSVTHITVNGIKINIASMQKIIADKIEVISGDKKRITKDTIRLYAFLLNHDYIKLSEILDCIEKANMSIGDFLNFILTKDKITREFNKYLKKIKFKNGQPSNETIYEVIKRFVKPFQNYAKNKLSKKERFLNYWSKEEMKWKQAKSKKESLLLESFDGLILKVNIK